MKNFKRISAIFLTIIIFVLSLPTVTVFAADADMRYGRVQLGKMSNGTNLQYVYDQLVSGCKSAKEEIKIDLNEHNISFDEIKTKVYPLFYSDYPEYFWIDGAWDGSSNSTELIIKPSYTMTGNKLDSAKSAYNAKVNELTSGLSGSDYDKAKTLHDRLIDTVTYTFTSNDQNAYGALVEGQAVCNGYAKAYQHLMLKAGIPTWFVRGTSTNPTAGTPIAHAWNLVKLDGKWYYTDVTWDDQGANTFYTYFNITTKQLLEGHTFDDLYASLVPTATATAANYYIKEERNFTKYDQSKLVSLLKKDNRSTQIYLDDNADNFVSSLNTNLLSIAAELGANGNYEVAYNISQLGNAMIINLIIISENHNHRAQTTIDQVNATCLSTGTKAHYVCDCGLQFLDFDCTQQVTSISQLEIKASSHIDKNTDKKCDACDLALSDENESNNITASDDTADNNNTETSSGTENTESTESTEESINDDGEIIITDRKTDASGPKQIFIIWGSILAISVVTVIFIIVKKR